MAFSIVGTHTDGDAVTNSPITLPGTVAEDDLVVAVGASDVGNDSITTSGYTAILTDDTEIDDPENCAGYKVMGATPDSNISYADGGAGVQIAAVIRVYRGINPTTPIAVTRNTATGISGMPNPPSTSGFESTDLAFIIGLIDDITSWTPTAPSGYGNLASAIASTDGGACVIADKESPSATEDPAVFGGSASDAWGAVTMGFAADAVTHTVTGNAITSSAPVVDSGALVQTHSLTGNAINGGAPVVDSGALTQVHTVVGTAINGAAPTIDSVAISEIVTVTGNDINGGAPVIDSPAVTEITSVIGNDIAGTAPAIDSGVLAQVHNLAGNEILGAAPILDSPSVTEANLVIGDSILGSAPVIDQGIIFLGEVLPSLRVRQDLQDVNQWVIGGFPIASQQTKTDVFLKSDATGVELRARDYSEGEYVGENPIADPDKEDIFIKERGYDYTSSD